MKKAHRFKKLNIKSIKFGENPNEKKAKSEKFDFWFLDLCGFQRDVIDRISPMIPKLNATFKNFGQIDFLAKKCKKNRWSFNKSKLSYGVHVRSSCTWLGLIAHCCHCENFEHSKMQQNPFREKKTSQKYENTEKHVQKSKKKPRKQCETPANFSNPQKTAKKKA